VVAKTLFDIIYYFGLVVSGLETGLEFYKQYKHTETGSDLSLLRKDAVNCVLYIASVIDK
jgi:hypothetical protein